MISKEDLQRLIEREAGDKQILSVFLDMSVNSDNKRTHQIFLNRRRAQFDELDSDRAGHHREALGAAFARIDRWLEEEYREENRGAVLYLEVGGDWFEAMQFPVPVQNRLIIDDRPIVAPLAQVLEAYDHHGVVLLDREHVRILSIYLGTLLDEIEVRGEPHPAPHDIQPGGYSQKRYQRRKLEETKQFFKEFSREVEEFVRRYKPDDLVVLGTEENVAKFLEFLPERVREMVVYTGPMAVDEPAGEVMSRLQPHLEAHREKEGEETVRLLRERVQQDYLATGGLQSTLTALQEGKVDTLVLARDLQVGGVRCAQCGFIFADGVASCRYCGGEEKAPIDAVEEMVRMAEGQGSSVEFVDSATLSDMRGVGALLRF